MSNVTHYQAVPPDLKPAIERVFHTFSHDLLPVAPCYVGHDVATRQRIRDQEDFAKRLMKRAKKDEEAEALTIGMTPEELQAFCDKWSDFVYMHRPHSGLERQNAVSDARRVPAQCPAHPGSVPRGARRTAFAGHRHAPRYKRRDRIGGKSLHRSGTRGSPRHAAGVEIRFDKARPEYACVYHDGLFLCRRSASTAWPPKSGVRSPLTPATS